MWSKRYLLWTCSYHKVCDFLPVSPWTHHPRIRLRFWAVVAPILRSQSKSIIRERARRNRERNKRKRGNLPERAASKGGVKVLGRRQTLSVWFFLGFVRGLNFNAFVNRRFDQGRPEKINKWSNGLFLGKRQKFPNLCGGAGRWNPSGNEALRILERNFRIERFSAESINDKIYHK